MTEDINKKKPKATLIKHKKRVVVVKKVIVKKVPTPEPPGDISVEAQSTPTVNKETAKTGETGNLTETVKENKIKQETPKPVAPTKISQQEINADEKIKDTPGENQQKTSLPEKKLEVENNLDSYERIGTGKDTAASPPGKLGNRGVQVLEIKREGGKAGFVGGRRVDGRFRSSVARKSSERQQQNHPDGHRQGDFSQPDGNNRRNFNRPLGSNALRTNPPGSGRTVDGRPVGGRTVGGRTVGGRTVGGRTVGGRTIGGRPVGGRPVGGRPVGGRPVGGRPVGGRPVGGRPVGGRPVGGRPVGGRPGTSRSSEFNTPPAPPGVARGKKFYKAKKTYEKRKEQQEKHYQYTKKKQVIQTNPVPKKIDIMEVITVSSLARKMNLRASDLISKLMGMGMMVTINQQIDAETATILADDYGCKVNIVSLYDETIIESDNDDMSSLIHRPPVVTVMGHVDHGKTKLLDTIRNTDVIAEEHGGITQHIGAYMVRTEDGRRITFLDTPGHSAFTMMRARGAKVTDLVVLVVAANDGVMPRTIEAINHAQAANSPIIIAINKMDLPDANPDRVRQQLSKYNLIPENWGGSTQFVEISALKNEGIKELLDTLLLESEMLELKANWDCRAEGKIIESKIDKGRGVVATVLVEKGTLNVGDSFVAGIFHGKVRAMFDDNGTPVQQATPAMPVEILGFSEAPNAGDPFQVTENEREARRYGSKRQELRKIETARNVKKVTLDNLYDSIQDGEIQELKVIIKGDVHGSVEALQNTLEELSNDEIRLVCIRAAAGAIIEDDVNLAAASDAIIIGFHVRPTAKALAVAEGENVEIRKYNIIFEAVEDIKTAMEGMLTPDFEEVTIGRVEVRETFKVPKIGTIAGCMVTSGSIMRKSMVHLIRDSIIIHTGSLASLKRFKDDVKEVKESFECGIGLEKFSDVQTGDVLEVFEKREVTKKLGASDRNE